MTALSLFRIYEITSCNVINLYRKRKFPRNVLLDPWTQSSLLYFMSTPRTYLEHALIRWKILGHTFLTKIVYGVVCIWMDCYNVLVAT